jgi:hypothetical protein
MFSVELLHILHLRAAMWHQFTVINVTFEKRQKGEEKHKYQDEKREMSWMKTAVTGKDKYIQWNKEQMPER